ncbi:MAG: hypothetical protein IPH18_04355 [Chitinophagaceae bacterium]|nr:hypothetical protein [Chitinophagaceae bacterium]MBK8953849.1 hypothetical protein [Chitinophagaceae bacterium]
MKNLVKLLVTSTCCLLLAKPGNSQLKLPLANGTGTDIRKVIEDYPNRFQNLSGQVRTIHAQSTDYECTLKITGAEECFITRYPDEEDKCSWQAVLLTTENFEKAKQRFKSQYNQLNNISVTIGGQAFKLKGDYVSPSEGMKFTSVLFSFNPDKEAVRKLKTELILEFSAPAEWKVKLLVYDRERSDEESGAEK